MVDGLTGCIYCCKEIPGTRWTWDQAYNEAVSNHYKNCKSNPINSGRNPKSSLTEWEFEEFMKKSIEWKKNG